MAGKNFRMGTKRNKHIAKAKKAQRKRNRVLHNKKAVPSNSTQQVKGSEQLFSESNWPER